MDTRYPHQALALKIYCMPHFMPMFIFQTDAQTVIFLVVLLAFEDAVT